ncbi:hypothetical protein [Methylobacterium nonmethylotrophicum]|uniref:Uncharacterized protein n=1 Tax=Methylobacterium nonmethylotrophicum TaxID=1141884 RepID=A0A4Z0NPA8_9HYPH|nr:hypothetical protein [Methylobacterium nonmethylotrophicum]TGD98670.1 hypothetical protein EU555_15125 [Methylobacterium nonmethylotrophicum]
MDDPTASAHRPTAPAAAASFAYRTACALLACLAAGVPAGAQDDGLAARPAFSRAEEPARRPATCADLPGQLAGLPAPSTRIDLSIQDALTLVQTDGALWYLAVCHSPAVRVLCITYARNGMQAGERVVLRGGYNRQDETHIVLDPCLAARP